MYYYLFLDTYYLEPLINLIIEAARSGSFLYFHLKKILIIPQKCYCKNYNSLVILY